MIQINIEFLQQPVDDDFVSFDLVGSFFNDTVSFTFKDTVADPVTEVQIGATLSDTINNTLNFLNTNFFFPYLVRGEWVRNGNTINTFIVDDNPTVVNIVDVPEFVVVNSEILRTFLKKIFSRSPYWVVVDLPNQTQASVEVYIWNEGQTEPTIPTYTVKKDIPAINRTKLSFDLSPYIREFIDFERQTTPNTPEIVNPFEYCNVRIKAFSDLSQILNEAFISFYGYGDFTQGWNPDNGNFSQEEGTYLYDRSKIPTFVYFQDFNAAADNDFRIQYRDLNGGNTTNVSLLTVTGIQPWEIPLSTTAAAYDTGNEVAIQEEIASVWTDRHVIKMIPQCEPKYTPLKCDFVNKWGAWQSITFFKRSDETFEVKGSKYQLMPSSEDYNIYRGEMQSFNVNGKESIKVNTGWVDEHYKEIIRELLLSETILIDDLKVTPKTQSTELFKKVNTKVINYTLDFEYAFAHINKIS
jgi:hypothetical protein